MLTTGMHSSTLALFPPSEARLRSTRIAACSHPASTFETTAKMRDWCDGAEDGDAESTASALAPEAVEDDATVEEACPTTAFEAGSDDDATAAGLMDTRASMASFRCSLGWRTLAASSYDAMFTADRAE